MTVYVGAKSPESLKLIVKDPSFNFTVINAVDLQIKPPGADTPLTWSWALDTSVSGQITLTHTFASGGGDVPKPGRYTITGWLLTGASPVRRIAPAYFEAQLYQ